MKPKRPVNANDALVPDAYEMDSINLMVFLLSKGLETDTLNEIIDYMNKLSLHYTQAVEKIEMLQDQVNFDTRTGLLRYQSSYFENIFKNISRIFSSYQTPMGHDKYHLSYIRLDIDDFSFFNNRYGHEVGDEALRLVGEAIRKTARPTDFSIRYGGEEFDIILTSTPPPGAIGFLERLFQRFEDIRVPAGDEILTVTLSAGVSYIELPFHEILSFDHRVTESLNLRVQRQADHALYDAKNSGKNRWCVFDPTRIEEYDRIRAAYAVKPKK